MTTLRRHASHSSAEDARGQRSVATRGRAYLIDVTVTEWTVDLGARADGRQASATTSLAAVGFVDFDAVESLHPFHSEATSRR